MEIIDREETASTSETFNDTNKAKPSVNMEDESNAHLSQQENITSMDIEDSEETVETEMIRAWTNSQKSITTDAQSATNLSSAPNKSEGEKAVKTFEEILISMVKNNKQDEKNSKTRHRLCHGAEIITSQEYFKKKQEEENRRQIEKKETLSIPTTSKINKSKKRKVYKPAKKTNSTISDSDKMDSDVSDCLSDELESDDNIPSSISVITEDYVKVYYKGRYYLGKVLEICPSGIKISHMIKSGLKGKGWKWPKNPDELLNEEEDTVQVIKPPIPLNNRGLFNVPEVIWD